jgi:hypothetical protein
VTREIARANLLSIIAGVQEAIRSIGTFDRPLWAAALALYRSGDAGAFIDDFTAEIENQLTRAWNAGAQEMGVSPDEFTQDDKTRLDTIIKNEYDFVLKLAQDITDARGNKLDEFRNQFRPRVDMWVNRFREAQNTARVYFGGKKRLEFVLGPTEQHCHTGDRPGKVGCADLAGIVLFATEWNQTGIIPNVANSSVLACGGWHCECQLRPTDKSRTPRGLSRVLDMMTGVNL